MNASRTAPDLADATAEALRDVIGAGRLAGLRWPDFGTQREALDRIYRQSEWRTLWTSDGRPTPQARIVVAHLAAAAASGLRPEDYDGPALTERLEAITAKTPASELARLDVAVSLDLMRNLSDLRIGRANPDRAAFRLELGERTYELAELLAELARSGDAGAWLARVEPRHERYALLVRALARYRALAADPALVPPPDLAGLRPGARQPGVPALRRWLEGLGHVAPVDPVTARSDLYDPALVDAVKRFQAVHALTPDGVLGKATSQALRVPLPRRVRQIELSLERLRWLPDSFSRPPILINIPEFRLYALAGSGAGAMANGALTMKVIVGKALETETPSFSGELEYVVFRPYWNVPRSILVKEMLPKIRSDPGYLLKERLEIVGAGAPTQAVTPSTLAGLAAGALGLRQRPGPENSLGLVKFIFPNEENVYLHGTPAKALFARQRRDFSHGCIRVEDPVALAEHVLRDQPVWTRERILAAMQSGATKQVDLGAPIPVHVVYLTAMAGPGGEVGFFEDLYQHDAQLEKQLARGDAYPG